MHRDDDAQRGSLHDRCRLCHQFKPMVIGDQLCYDCGEDAPLAGGPSALNTGHPAPLPHPRRAG